VTHHYTVLHGGTVLTLDEALPSDAATRALRRADLPDAAGRRATAICFAHDRVLAVGSDADVLALAGWGTRVVDLHGRCVVPGFVDPHAHPLWEGVAAGEPSLDDAADLRAALRLLAGHAAALEPDAWLVARYDHDRWPERRHPTRDELDRAVPDRPVLLDHRSGHAVAANSLALALAGIDPPLTAHGFRDALVERDEHGLPTGVITGSDASGCFAAARPPLTGEEAAAALRRAGRALAADGVTAVSDADLGASGPLDMELAAYAAAIANGSMAQRVGLLPGLVRLAPQPDDPLPAPAEWESAIPAGLRDRLGVAATKLFADGALTTHDAWLEAPYADEPASAGHPAIDPAELVERVRRAAAAGWVVATHAIGDAAISATLAAYVATPAPAGARHRLEHAIVLAPGHVAALARSGVAAVVQPEFVAWAGDIYRSRLGDDRCRRLLPYAELLAAGVPLAFSSDRPVTSGSPLAGIGSAIRHAGPSGRRLSAAPAPSAAEALHAWTVAGARLMGADGEAGRLAVGHAADLVVLSADPTTVPAAAWAAGEAGLAVAATVIRGTLVHGEL
jgi:predicted amidohydrolase YtcJ